MCSQVQASWRWYLLERIDMGGDRPLVAGRPQAQVELVEHALGGRRRDRRDQALRQPREVVRRRERLRRRRIPRRRRRGRRAGSGRRRSRRSARGCRACPCRGSPPCRPATRPWRAANSASTASSAAPIVRSARSENALPARAGSIAPVKQPHADQEFLLGGEDAQPVEDLLIGADAFEEGREARRQIGACPAVRTAAPDRAGRRRHAGAG